MTTGTHRDARYPQRIPRFLRSHPNMFSTNIIVLGLRVAQFTLAFVVLGLTAYVANWYNVDTMSTPPPQVGWLLFVALFNIISIGVLEGLPRFAPRFFHPYAALSLDFGNALFYLAGFLALSTFMSRLLFCRGSVCSAARADVAFSIFEFLLWAATTFFTAKDVFKKGLGFRRSKNTQAPLGAPPMKEAPAP
ncbi:membrane-associating domain-containing protein [Nemania sp. FL0031]|nr:membrane-associating domain-containing protein [Nemania sp. FL0031]